MKSPASIKLKAAFALIVFSLNTVVGFACFAGLDMGYNSTHHAVPAATGKIAHIHKEDQGPTHHGKKGIYGQDRSPDNDQATNTQKSKSDKENCCTDEVKAFQEISKSIPGSVNIVHPALLTAFLPDYFNIPLSFHTHFVRDIRPFLRSYHPPIPDIRIAVQSFLI